MKVSYYKLQIVRSFFNIFLQLIVLLITIALKFIYALSIDQSIIPILLYIKTALLLISIFSQTFVVMSIYYLFVEPKNK